MPENASVFIATQLGVEVTPGTAVAANRLLQALQIEPSIKPEIKSFRPRGQKYNLVSVLGKEYVEAKISGDASYNDLVYLFSSALSYAAPTQIIPTTGLAYQWTHTPNQTTPDTIETFTVQSGSAARAQQFAFGLVNEIGYKLNREEFTISGSMIGQAISDGITMTAAPTVIPFVPIPPTAVSVYLDPTSAALGTTQLMRAFELDYKVSNIYGQVWPLNASQASFAGYIELAPKAELKLKVEVDVAGMGNLTNMRAGSKQFMRVKATGADIDPSANPYTFQHDMCLEVTNVSAFEDDKGVYAVEWTFEISYDTGWAKSQTIELINTLATL